VHVFDYFVYFLKLVTCRCKLLCVVMCMQTWGNPGKELPRRASVAVHRHNRYSTELSAGKEAWTCDEVYRLWWGLHLYGLFCNIMVQCLHVGAVV